MITKKTFRFIVLAGFLPLIMILTFEFPLHPELKSFVDHQWSDGISLFIYIGILISLFSFVGQFGLLFFARWARPVFTVGSIGASFTMFFYDPYVVSSWENTFGEFSLLLRGFIIALIYFSDLSVYFQKGSHNQSLESDGNFSGAVR